jgi:hypothetical protein
MAAQDGGRNQVGNLGGFVATCFEGMEGIEAERFPLPNRGVNP